MPNECTLVITNKRYDAAIAFQAAPIAPLASTYPINTQDKIAQTQLLEAELLLRAQNLPEIEQSLILILEEYNLELVEYGKGVIYTIAEGMEDILLVKKRLTLKPTDSKNNEKWYLEIGIDIETGNLLGTQLINIPTEQIK